MGLRSSVDERVFAAHILAVTLVKMDLGDPTDTNMDFFAEEVATTQGNILADPDFWPKEDAS